METKITTATALAASIDGEPLEYACASASGVGATRVGSAELDTDLTIGSAQEVILWVRRLSAVGAQVVKMASVTWTEEW